MGDDAVWLEESDGPGGGDGAFKRSYQPSTAERALTAERGLTAEPSRRETLPFGETLREPRVITARPPAAPSSLLFGDDPGMNALAVQIGRGEGPTAYRDEFDGERGAYQEYFLDVQGGGPGWGGYGSFGGNNYTYQRFRAERVGTFSR